jgi:hypothetical protein
MVSSYPLKAQIHPPPARSYLWSANQIRAPAPRCGYAQYPHAYFGFAMPLPNVAAGTARRCTAHTKCSGERCPHPAAFGMPTCRKHGARRPVTVKRGKDHPQYRHGRATPEGKAENSRRLAELRNLEALSFAFGLAVGPRWRGRKPKTRRM